jgi:hypothetical protein
MRAWILMIEDSRHLKGEMSITIELRPIILSIPTPETTHRGIRNIETLKFHLMGSTLPYNKFGVCTNKTLTTRTLSNGKGKKFNILGFKHLRSR